MYYTLSVHYTTSYTYNTIHCIAVCVTMLYYDKYFIILYYIVNIDQDEMKLILVSNYYLAGKINQDWSN